MMITKNNDSKKITIEDLEDAIHYSTKLEILNNSTGKTISRRLDSFKDGDIVTLKALWKPKPGIISWIKIFITSLTCLL